MRVCFLALLAAGAWILGCGGGGAVAPPPPPPPSISVTVTPTSGSVVLGNQLTLTATVTNATDTSVSWSVSNIAGGNSSVDPSKKAQATIAIQPGVSVNVSPGTATLAAGHRVTLVVQVNGTSNTAVNWSVNGIPGGSSVLGQICLPGSNPCQVVASTTTSSVDYLAPGSIPSPNPVSATAVSAVDPTKSASTQITVINHVLISVQPPVSRLRRWACRHFKPRFWERQIKT